MKITVQWVLAALLLAGGAWAVEPMQTGTVLLTLAEGIKPTEPGDRETRDMELDLHIAGKARKIALAPHSVVQVNL